MSIHAVTVRVLRIPLHTPYRVSRTVFHHFEPIVVEVWDGDGRYGFGEAVISEGYSRETFEDGLRWCRDVAPRLVGKGVEEARALLEPGVAECPTAASTLFSALDVLAGHPLLDLSETARVPLLDPVHAHEPGALAEELEALLARGFRTLKVKVGFDVDADLERVRTIRNLLDGRAEVRLDANQGFTREEGRRFAAALEPAGIQLFEQPCAADDWESNAAVARVSAVPVMMDESIYGLEDIDRAAAMEGVGFVKLKLKKLASMDRLREGLERIRAVGLTPVMGDGVATDLSCWLEACVARVTLDNAGEMNGHLKLVEPLFAEPLPFEDGAIVLRPGAPPTPDPERLERLTTAKERFSAASSAVRQEPRSGPAETERGSAALPPPSPAPRPLVRERGAP